MIFLTPLFLAGLAAVGIPIVVHLMHRAKTAPLDWPTLRFIKVARQQSAQRARIKNILVLFARCLMLALLAVAFAKPFHTDEEWSRPVGLPTTMVLVLDNSYSMGYREGGGSAPAGADADRAEEGTRFARAKELALRQLSGLSLEDEVGLVVFNEQSVALTERPTRDHEAVRKLVREARPSDRGSDLAPALTSAFAIAQLDA